VRKNNVEGKMTNNYQAGTILGGTLTAFSLFELIFGPDVYAKTATGFTAYGTIFMTVILIYIFMYSCDDLSSGEVVKHYFEDKKNMWKYMMRKILFQVCSYLVIVGFVSHVLGVKQGISIGLGLLFYAAGSITNFSTGLTQLEHEK
jgi:predicted permease